MLEPEGLSPKETLLPRKGEGLGVGLGSLLGTLCLPALVPVICSCSMDWPAGAGCLAQSPVLAYMWLSPGPCSPPLAPQGPWEGPSAGGPGLTHPPPSLPEAGRAEEQPMEISVSKSPVAVPSRSQEPGEKSSWWTCRWGWGRSSVLSRPSLPAPHLCWGGVGSSAASELARAPRPGLLFGQTQMAAFKKEIS